MTTTHLPGFLTYRVFSPIGFSRLPGFLASVYEQALRIFTAANVILKMETFVIVSVKFDIIFKNVFTINTLFFLKK